MHRIWFCARFGAALVLMSVVHGLPAGAATLTFSDAQHAAAQRSQQLVAQEASIRSAREMAIAAGQLPDAVVRMGIDNYPVDGPDRFIVNRDFMTMRRMGVMQEFTGSEKRRLRAERFEREADRASAEMNASLATIQRDTAVAWLETFYLERLRAAVSQQLAESRLEIDALQGAYRAGRTTQADVLTAQSGRVMLEDRLSELGRRIRNARVLLARWVGEEHATAELVNEPALDKVPPHTSAVVQELERHPSIAVVTQEVALAETDIALARANKRPDWTWEFAYQRRGYEFSDMISVGVSIPLQWDRKNRQDRELAAKLAAAEKARAQREEILRQHVAEVQAMVNEWENGRERLGRYQRELLPLARDRTQALVSAYRGGKSDLASVIAARRNEIEVRAQTLQLEIDTARVWAQLHYLYPDHSVHVHPTTGKREERK